MSSWARAALVLGAAGAVLGTLLDGIHTHTGTTWYPHPVFWLAASWTPAIFAFAGLSIGLTRPLLDRALKRDEPPPRRWRWSAPSCSSWAPISFPASIPAPACSRPRCS